MSDHSDNGKMTSLTVQFPAPLATYLKTARLSTDELSYGAVVRQALEQAKDTAVPTLDSNGKRITVRFDPADLPEGNGNLSERLRSVLWLDFIKDRERRLEEILANFIPEEQRKHVREQISHQIIWPLTGRVFPEEKEKVPGNT